MKHWVRIVTFGTFSVLVLLLMAGTVIEKLEGTEVAYSSVYASTLFITLWAVAAISSVLYLLQCRIYKKVFTFALHLSFVLILCGAAVTHFWGVHGSIHLREGAEYVIAFRNSGGGEETLPFKIALQSFQTEYYPGTYAPMDYISTVSVVDKGRRLEGKVSMNRIFSYRHYRFYQSAYDADHKGTTLLVAYDPWGIGMTYTGYGCLFVCSLLFFMQKGSLFRGLLRHPALKSGRMMGFLLVFAGLPYTLSAARMEAPLTVSVQTAEALGNLYVYYNGRICPLQTMAKDFTVKVYGKASYKGLTSEQVLAGWLFYYDRWKEEPFIRIKDKTVRRYLGTEEEYVSLDCLAGDNGWRLEEIIRESSDTRLKRAVEETNEKFNLISMVCTGAWLKLYPYGESQLVTPMWYSPADKLPDTLPQEEWQFIRHSLNYLAEQILHGKDEEAVAVLRKIRLFQIREAGAVIPDNFRFRAEKLYNKVGSTRMLAMCCVIIGIIAMMYACGRLVGRLEKYGICSRYVALTMTGALWTIWIYLLAVICLRGYIGGHLPLSNGFETMQFMAFGSVSVALVLRKRFFMILPFGFLSCGMALLVAMMGESNPSVTPLMPVLSSPLLSVHVMTIMLAYALLAFVMFNGVAALSLHYVRRTDRRPVELLAVVSRLLLYPAVALLAFGIFIGAVWANVSWGRYWGWDPKEVWALITMLVYASALHTGSLRRFNDPVFFHWFGILAFLCVIITYFGVNFFLGGMHSYA